MRCKNCGKKLKVNEIFCSSCGYYNGDKQNDSKDEKDNNFESESIDLSLNNNSDDDISLDDDFPSNDDGTSLDDDFPSNDDGTSLDDDFPSNDNDLLTEDNKDINDIEIQSFNTEEEDTKKKSFFDFQYDRFLEAYIGEDYKEVARRKINIYAFFLNWMYFLYRKLYIIGTIGLIITGIVLRLFTKYFLYYLIIVMVLSGLLFNPIYIFVAKKRVLYLKKKSQYNDDFSIEQLCAEKGGVNFVIALIIYALFLIIMFFSMYRIIFPSKHDKYFEKNSINKATCTSIIKNIYSSRESLKIDGNISEGLCNIVPGKTKNYNIYIKVEKDNSIYYLFYATQDDKISLKGNTLYINDLELKEQNKTISDEESTFLDNSRLIESKYKNIKNTSKIEDALIKKNKDTDEKLNYVLSEEEIKR